MTVNSWFMIAAICGVAASIVWIVRLNMTGNRERVRKPMRFRLRGKADQVDWKTTVYRPKEHRRDR